MRRKRQEVGVFGTAFLDVLSNAIGGLVFLLVMVILMMGRVVSQRPRVVTASLPEAYAGAPYSVWLAARDGGGQYRWSLESVAGVTGLVLDAASGRLSGIPRAPNGVVGLRTCLVSVACEGTAVKSKDPAERTDRKAFSLLLRDQKPVTPTTLKIRTQDPLPEAYRGRPYPLTLSAEGGQPPYRWSCSETPNGLTLSPEGAFSGSADALGLHRFRVTVGDSTGSRAETALSLSVAEKHPPPPPIPPLKVLTKAIPSAMAESSYVLYPSASGGTPPYRWQARTELPAWRTVPDGMALQGTPRLADTGERSVVLSVSDAAGQSDVSTNMILRVLPPADSKPQPLTILTTRIPKTRATEAFEAGMCLQGGFPPYRWEGGLQPPVQGLEFDRRRGILTGTPATAARSTLHASVVDRAGSKAEITLPVAVDPAWTPLRMITDTLTDGRVGSSYRQAMAATGGHPPYRWQIVSGALPTGLTLEAQSGQLVGTPRVAGPHEVRLAVSDAAGQKVEGGTTLRFMVLTERGSLPLSVPDMEWPALERGEDVRLNLTARGGIPPYSWTAQGLPAGLVVDSDTLAGEPRHAGLYRVAFRVEDGVGQTAAGKVTLRVASRVPAWLAYALAAALLVAGLLLAAILPAWWYLRRKSLPLRVTSLVLPSARASCHYEVQLACEGGVPPYRWAVVDGQLPPGMELVETGVLKGEPFKGVGVDQAKEVAFTVEVTDGAGQKARQQL